MDIWSHQASNRVQRHLPPPSLVDRTGCLSPIGSSLLPCINHRSQNQAKVSLNYFGVGTHKKKTTGISVTCWCCVHVGFKPSTLNLGKPGACFESRLHQLYRKRQCRPFMLVPDFTCISSFQLKCEISSPVIFCGNCNHGPGTDDLLRVLIYKC